MVTENLDPLSQGRGRALHRGSRGAGRPTAPGTLVVTAGVSRLASSRALTIDMALGERLSIGAVYRRPPRAPQAGHVAVGSAVPMGRRTSQGPHSRHSYR
jgi:hypothetical protein